MVSLNLYSRTALNKITTVIKDIKVYLKQATKPTGGVDV